MTDEHNAVKYSVVAIEALLSPVYSEELNCVELSKSQRITLHSLSERWKQSRSGSGGGRKICIQ